MESLSAAERKEFEAFAVGIVTNARALSLPRFRRPVVPGSTLYIHVERVPPKATAHPIHFDLLELRVGCAGKPR